MLNENKALVERWFTEVWNEGRAAAIDELLAKNCHVFGFGPNPLSHDQFKEFHAEYRTAFPDVHIHLDEVIAEGDVVAARWSGSGTHRGALRGFAATHTRASFTGMVFIHVKDGKIVDGWNMFNEAEMMQQLGAAPAAE